MTPRKHLHALSWEQVHADVFALAGQIQASDFQPDLIVGVGYGGIIPATLLYFALPEVRFRIAYPAASNHGFAEELQGISGKRVLLADDLAITGDSLREMRDAVTQAGAAQVATACLYATQGYEGLDFRVRSLEDGELIVFPWYTRRSEAGLQIMAYKNRFGKHEPME